MTLEEAQKQVDQWVKTYGVRYFSELTNMAVLTEEVGELARVMARKYGDQSFKEGEKDNIEEEIADVLWVLLCIANQTGVDVTAALQILGYLPPSCSGRCRVGVSTVCPFSSFFTGCCSSSPPSMGGRPSAARISFVVMKPGSCMEPRAIR